MSSSKSLPIVAITPHGALWPELLAHLERVEQSRYAFTPEGSLPPDTYFLAVVIAGDVVGNIGVTMQDLVVPGSSTSAGLDHTLRKLDGAPLCELYVQTFAVEPEHRRLGYGRVLQLAALELARELGCHQLRSWSTVDRFENYALKLSLGFAVHPAIHHSSSTGLDYSGVYFVKSVA